ncbi:MAG TPA: BON domain-containing protein [Pyrinomonadaceae bacterium]|jgi:osmotically-inducible protein OsmY
MNKGVALVGGVGLGAALMYIFDPDRGKRRRALIRDKVEAAGNKVAEQAEKMRSDLGNRAYGVVAETKSIFRHDEVSDEVLVDRVRSRLGRIPVHVGAFDISADNGTVTLRGQILADELPKVLRATRFVRGVKDVDNQFQVHQTAGNVPDLQGQPQPLGAS